MCFTPTKRGDGKCFSHAEGGGTTSFKVVLTRELKVLAIVTGGTKSFTVLRGGRKMFWTRDFPIL